MISVTMDDIKSCGATLDEAGALIDIPRTLDTAKASLSLREMQNGIKVSFRSNHIDVSKIAEGFGGGGHERAAACVLKMGLQEAKATLTCELEKYI